MTETEWLACTDPAQMLEFLGSKATERKLRLFACACCRRIWDLLPTDACRKGIEIAERYAEGLATNWERSSAQRAVILSAEEEGIELFDSYYHELIEWGCAPGGLAFTAITELLAGTFDAAEVASHAALEVAWDARRMRQGEAAGGIAFEEVSSVEKAAQSQLLRDLQHPYHRLSLRPVWLTWNRGTVRKIAGVIDEKRVFDRLPILADALEEAGCGEDAILGHLRGPGPHVRGCWAIDLVLGKS